MVNFKKLSDRAKKAKDLVDQQGGTDALKDKAEQMKTATQGQGSMSDKAKAAAEVAREKPKPEPRRSRGNSRSPCGADGADGAAPPRCGLGGGEPRRRRPRVREPPPPVAESEVEIPAIGGLTAVPSGFPDKPDDYAISASRRSTSPIGTRRSSSARTS